MMKRVITLIWMLILLIPTLASAQGQPTLQSMLVELWPEYDQPSMLVILHITIPSDTSLPVSLTQRIPAAAGKPNAVAARQPDGSLINLNYEQQQAGDWLELKFTMTTSEGQIEYYDPSLSVQGSLRTYVFSWSGDSDIKNMSVQFQQPPGATALALPASFGSGVVGQDGLTYYTANIGAITAAQPLAIDISYQKANDDLTIKSLNVAPSAPIEDNPSKWMSVLPWALAVLGVVLIVGGVYWYWHSGRQKPSTSHRSRHKPAADKASQVYEGYVYCHQCGKRATPGDRFCRTCGTQLRTSNGN